MPSKQIIDKIGKLIVRLIIVFGFIFLLAPLVFTIMMSFDPRTYVTFEFEGFTLKWYESFLLSPMFQRAIVSSLTLATCATLITLTIATPCALALTRYDIRGKELLHTFLLSPLTVPALIFGSSLLSFFTLIYFRDSFIKLLIGHTIIAFPYALRAIYASLLGLDKSLEEAAMSLGANEFTVFSDIILPLIKPGMIAATVFIFATSLDDVGVSIFLTDAYTFTLPVALFAYMKENLDPTIAAASAILAVPTIIAIIVMERTIGISKFLGMRTK